MARTEKTLVVFTDDIDGKEYSQEEIETITFALDGKSYEIDLNAEHADELRSALDHYISHARTAARRSTTENRPTVQVDPKAVRMWARKERIDVPARGRIPKAVLDKFHTAHK